LSKAGVREKDGRDESGAVLIMQQHETFFAAAGKHDLNSIGTDFAYLRPNIPACP
jgi:hypothetical protein